MSNLLVVCHASLSASWTFNLSCFLFATNLRADYLSPRTYGSGWTLLGLLSCLLIAADGCNQPLKFVRICALSLPTSVSYLYTCNDKLSPLPYRQRQHRTFLTSSLPFWQGKYHNVRALGSSEFSCANSHFATECSAQSLKFVRIGLS